MADNCVRDCPLREVVQEMKVKQEDMRKEVNDLKIESAQHKEREVTIFNMLKEIKDSIKILVTDVGCIKQKPGKTFEKLQYEVIKAIILLIVGGIAAKFLIIK